jgi:hypothetical protein
MGYCPCYIVFKIPELVFIDFYQQVASVVRTVQSSRYFTDYAGEDGVTSILVFKVIRQICRKAMSAVCAKHFSRFLSKDGSPNGAGKGYGLAQYTDVVHFFVPVGQRLIHRVLGHQDNVILE